MSDNGLFLHLPSKDVLNNVVLLHMKLDCKYCFIKLLSVEKQALNINRRLTCFPSVLEVRHAKFNCMAPFKLRKFNLLYTRLRNALEQLLKSFGAVIVAQQVAPSLIKGEDYLDIRLYRKSDKGCSYLITVCTVPNRLFPYSLHVNFTNRQMINAGNQFI